MLFTTSWDDGYPSDERVAALLSKYGAKGTFYFAKTHEHLERPHDEGFIKDLARTMEIGAHTLTHRNLPPLNDAEAREEIAGSKKWLEDLLGKECAMFCYPRGKYDERIKGFVQDAGYRGARGTTNFRFSHKDTFEMPSTLHSYPFPVRPILDPRAFEPVRRWAPELRRLGVPMVAWRGWLPMATTLFDAALARGEPWFHLRGHSWEIDHYGMWEPFEAFLAHAAAAPVTHGTNADLLAY